MKMNIGPGQDQQHVTRIEARVIDWKTNYRGLTVFFLQGFKRKRLGVDDECL